VSCRVHVSMCFCEIRRRHRRTTCEHGTRAIGCLRLAEMRGDIFHATSSEVGDDGGKGSPRELLGVGWVEVFAKSSFVLQYQNLRVDFDIAIQESYEDRHIPHVATSPLFLPASPTPQLLPPCLPRTTGLSFAPRLTATRSHPRAIP